MVNGPFWNYETDRSIAKWLMDILIQEIIMKNDNYQVHACEFKRFITLQFNCWSLFVIVVDLIKVNRKVLSTIVITLSMFRKYIFKLNAMLTKAMCDILYGAWYVDWLIDLLIDWLVGATISISKLTGLFRNRE